ncbi:MAG: pyridoxamine 5'-phosphate oxidase [Bacteroidia bacterium]|nr:MAG: pyridoxamine 5'-phosphate oxidase [Bacteroidia bacterium]
MDENSDKDLGQVRREYSLDRMDDAQLPSDPMLLFGAWMEQARQSENLDPTAMTLSTVEEDGNPSSRIVLLKKIDRGRLVFFTNYSSRKAREIQSSSRVAAHFYWPELERQVKIAGKAEPLEDAESDRYFQSRPFESQVAAWASPQSTVVPHREYLENEYRRYLEKFKGSKVIPRPEFWGGFAVTPSRIEFWQGGKFRLHDRIEYALKDEQWTRVRLAP